MSDTEQPAGPRSPTDAERGAQPRPPAPPTPPSRGAPQPVAATHADDTKAEREARIAATRGAQVVLEPDSPIALAAKGGMHATMQGNVAARDAALIEAGLNPLSPSAHLTDPPPAKPTT